MKITALLLLVACLQASAKGLAQQVSLVETKAPLEKVLQTIKKQTGYALFYDVALLKQKGKPVNVNVQNVPLTAALQLVFADQVLTYEITGNTILVKEKTEKKVAEEKAVPPPPIDVKGNVTDETGKPVAGAAVRVKGTNKAAITNDAGEFELKGIDDKAVLVVSAINIEPREVIVGGRTVINITTKIKVSALDDVAVQVNTGYQQIPKERATGSFSVVNNELFNRRVSSDVLSRLDGVVTGIFFNPGSTAGNGKTPINIRGQSKLSAFVSSDPIIVVDNFPYEGDLNSINPNDVESVTLLKDAAAASIWGARAGNGVIVITTKKGNFNGKLKVQFNSNFTIGNKPNVYYGQNFIDSKNYIELEKYLFDNGYYNSMFTNTTTYPAISPAVEIYQQIKSGTITQADGNTQLQRLFSNDYRDDYTHYFQQKSLAQQYSINMNGGGFNSKYFVGIGYDKRNDNLVGNSNHRITVNSNGTYVPVKNLELTTSMVYSNTKTTTNNPYSTLNALAQASYPLFPYADLVADDGTALSITYKYRQRFKDSLQQLGFLDWNMRPYEEIFLADNTSIINNLRLNLSAKYQVLPSLLIELNYQNETQSSNARNYNNERTFFSRDLVNRYSEYTASTKTFKYNIPKGGILDLSNSKLSSNNLRFKTAFNKTIKHHAINAIAGAEIRETTVENTENRMYGYTEETGKGNSVLDYLTSFTLTGANPARVPYNGGNVSGTTQRFVSYFGNAAYTYQSKYTFSGSFRKDGANIFGVRTNDKVTPLWSTGLAWELSKEKFFHTSWLPFLRLRTTYGFSGNVYNGSAFLTASYLTSNLTLYPTAVINSAPNFELRWEKIRNINIGIDFKTKNSAFTGSIELYQKDGTDLIDEIPIAAITGFSTYRGNASETRNKGIEVTLATKNLKGKFQWTTNFIFNFSTDKVLQYYRVSVGSSIVNGGAIKNYSINSLFSYNMAGIDPVNGDPLGYIGKDISKDYSKLINSVTSDSLIYHGSRRPIFFGSIRNTFSYKGFSVSANITCKFKYFFRRPTVSLNYQELLATGSTLHSDYLLRWKQPGDENTTTVPSLVYLTNTNRSTFYQYSQYTVERGDHIRLQDINVCYDFDKPNKSKLPFTHAQVYMYMNNIGILWKATKTVYDPDFVDVRSNGTYLPNPFTISIGARFNF